MLEAAFLVLIAAILTVVALRRRKRRSRSRGRRIFVPHNPSKWGAVYVMKFHGEPRFKIGTTRDRSRTRRAGIRSAVKRITGHAPEIYQAFAIDINYARKVERLTHIALKPYNAPIGPMKEFFYFPTMTDDEALHVIKRAALRAAYEARQQAILKGHWTDSMERSARIVYHHNGRDVRQPLFQTPNP